MGVTVRRAVVPTFAPGPTALAWRTRSNDPKPTVFLRWIGTKLPWARAREAHELRDYMAGYPVNNEANERGHRWHFCVAAGHPFRLRWIHGDGVTRAHVEAFRQDGRITLP